MRQDIIDSGIASDQVFTVPNLIELPAQPLQRSTADGESPLIGVCARLAEIKGVDIFIQAMAILKERGVACKAEIAGDGEQRAYCEQLIARHQLGDRVQLLGWIEDRDAFYQKLDIFCLPSREEAFGLVILESMKYGLPMVLSRLSGPQEIVADSDCALLAEAENPSSLADNLQKLIEDRALQNELSAKAWARVQAYGSQRVAPLLHATLETVCHKPN
jgi:glycosyltransferase involved in cell wall biosynthesis